jgi:hypothetical protein
MATTSAPRKMPRLLKATYLADQEYLLEETRATALFYLPGPIVFLLVFGFLAGITEAARLHWAGLQIGWYSSNVVDKLPKTDAHYLSYLFELLVVIGLLFLLVRYLRWVRTVYAVTNRRVIVQRGILSRDFDEIPVNQVRGVDVHQSIGDRMLGFGSVRVSSEGGSRLGNEDWKGIPKPFRFQKLIEDASQGSGPAQSH